MKQEVGRHYRIGSGISAHPFRVEHRGRIGSELVEQTGLPGKVGHRSGQPYLVLRPECGADAGQQQPARRMRHHHRRLHPTGVLFGDEPGELFGRPPRLRGRQIDQHDAVSARTQRPRHALETGRPLCRAMHQHHIAHPTMLRRAPTALVTPASVLDAVMFAGPQP